MCTFIPSSKASAWAQLCSEYIKRRKTWIEGFLFVFKSAVHPNRTCTWCLLEDERSRDSLCLASLYIPSTWELIYIYYVYTHGQTDEVGDIDLVQNAFFPPVPFRSGFETFGYSFSLHLVPQTQFKHRKSSWECHRVQVCERTQRDVTKHRCILDRCPRRGSNITPLR